MWDVNETFSLEGRRILGQRQGRSWSEPMTSQPILSFSLFFFFVLRTFPSCHSLRYVASWLKSALCQGRHISERHKTCRNINKQQAADSSPAPMPARRDEGKVRTLGGCCVVEVSSSGFTETQGRQDKVYQVIAQFKLLLGQQGHWDAGCQRICACVCKRMCVYSKRVFLLLCGLMQLYSICGKKKRCLEIIFHCTKNIVSNWM